MDFNEWCSLKQVFNISYSSSNQTLTKNDGKINSIYLYILQQNSKITLKLNYLTIVVKKNFFV